MISNTLIKMFNNGLYGKSIERCNNLNPENRKQRVEFRAFFIAEYDHMLREGQGPTNSQ